MEKSIIKVGDYITLYSILYDNTIYEVLDSNELTNKLRLKVVFPKTLAKELKEQNIFSIKSSDYSFKSLGNPRKNPNLRVLYG